MPFSRPEASPADPGARAGVPGPAPRRTSSSSSGCPVRVRALADLLERTSAVNGRTRACGVPPQQRRRRSRRSLVAFVTWTLREDRQNGKGYAPGSASTHLAAINGRLRPARSTSAPDAIGHRPVRVRLREDANSRSRGSRDRYRRRPLPPLLVEENGVARPPRRAEVLPPAVVRVQTGLLPQLLPCHAVECRRAHRCQVPDRRDGAWSGHQLTPAFFPYVRRRR
jgi:hypothetical protein